MNFFDRLSNGWTIAKNSFKVLKENKQLIIFPILSGISLLLIIGSFAIAILSAAGWNADNIDETRSFGNYAILFAFYIVNYFVVIFFNMALIHCTHLYFKGEEVSVNKGLRYSVSRIGAIFSWAVVAATVGLIFRIIQENVGSLGKIITGILGIAWSIATFFVVPIIAYEKIGPFAAIKRSTQLMKEKWGESLGATFSFGLIRLIAMLVLALPLFFIGSLINPVIGVALAVLAVFLVIAVMSAIETIFISAVYHNVTGDPVENYHLQQVESLFVTK
jgi:hypothetical protein